MVWTGFNKRFFDEFPHMEELALHEFAYFDDEEPGIFLIFEDILRPRLEECAENNAAEFTRLMAFIEQTAIQDPSLVWIGIGEWLPRSKHSTKILFEAGEHTLREIEAAESDRVRHMRNRESSPLLDMLTRLLSGSGKKETC